MSFNFTVPEKESKKAENWICKHKEVCEIGNDVGAIGGKHTWSFTQTGLGCIIVLKCACGEKIDLTDYKNW
jgi:hypothetical protein